MNNSGCRRGKVIAVKRKKLMKRLAQAKASDVSYAAGWDSWKVLNFSDNLVLAAIDDDNLLNGFQIIPLSFIESLEPHKPIQEEIERAMNLYQDLQIPEIDLTDWRTALESLTQQGTLISAEWQNGDGYQWRIGRIVRVKKHSFILRAFDADAVWQEPQKIPFDAIHYISFRDRYAEGWARWFQMHPESDMKKEIG